MMKQTGLSVPYDRGTKHKAFQNTHAIRFINTRIIWQSNVRLQTASNKQVIRKRDSK